MLIGVFSPLKLLLRAFIVPSLVWVTRCDYQLAEVPAGSAGGRVPDVAARL